VYSNSLEEFFDLLFTSFFEPHQRVFLGTLAPMVIKFDDISPYIKQKYLEAYIQAYKETDDYLNVLNLIQSLDEDLQKHLGGVFLKQLFKIENFSVITCELSGNMVNWVG